MANLGKLPDNVVMEILLRVPPESLIRFKCVSKSWYTLINDPIFSSSLPKRNVLVKRIVWNQIRDHEYKEEVIFSFLKYPLIANDDTPVDIEDVHLPSFDGEQFKFTNVCGHSRGIICFTIGPYQCIFLYNPATGDLRKLPPSIVEIPREQENGFYGPHVYSLSNATGFGYDPKYEVFKVVNVVDFFIPDSFKTNPHSLPSIAEVYDFKQDEWREIESIPGHIFGTHSCEMHYKGFYYWFATSGVGGTKFIQSFDMSKEVFGQIPLPESFKRLIEDGKYKNLGILNGSIVVFHYSCNGDSEREDRCFDVWEMVKSGDVVSWSKLLTIGPLFKIPYPLAFVGSDQLLMVKDGEQLVICDINTQKLKYFPLKGIWTSFQATVFIKTLVSVNGNDNGNGESILLSFK